MTAHPRGGVRELEHSRRYIELEFWIILIVYIVLYAWLLYHCACSIVYLVVYNNYILA